MIQIVNLSNRKVFKKFSGDYKIFRDVYEPGLLAIELSDLKEVLPNLYKK